MKNNSKNYIDICPYFRPFLLMFFIVMVMAVHGQAHLKILGIPINGNIEAFKGKLIAAGLKADTSLEAQKMERESNTCVFNGKYYGEDAAYHVQFTHDTQEVYEVSIFIVKDYYTQIDPIARDIFNAIEEKYTYKKEIKEEKLKQYYYYIYGEGTFIGVIDTFLLDTRNIPNLSGAMLTITYTDAESILKYEERKRRDI